MNNTVNENSILMSAEEVAQAIGSSKSKAYKIIQQLNDELKAAGYITMAGKVNRKFFLKKIDYQEEKERSSK